MENFMKNIIFIFVLLLLSAYYFFFKQKTAHPFLVAAGNGNLDQVKYYIENEGIDINYTQDPFGTAIGQASLSGYIDIVHYLIKRGADTSIKTLSGKTALFNATMRPNRSRLIKLLLESNIDVNAVDNDGGTALFNATLLKNNLETIKLLIENSASVNHVSNNGGTPLLNAAIGADLETVKYLLENGAKIVAGNNQIRPLHAAAEHGDLALVKLLVAQGDDPHAQMTGGAKPIDLARANQHGEVVQYLERL